MYGLRGEAMDFFALLDQVVDLLRSRGRVSYRALQRHFGLDDAYLDDLKVEMIDAQYLARDEHGSILVWPGGGDPPPPPLPSPPARPPVCHAGRGAATAGPLPCRTRASRGGTPPAHHPV